MADISASALAKARMEKDLQELKSMIAKHFTQREKDDQELEDLEQTIAKRKEKRVEQTRIRKEREKARYEKEREEKLKKEEEEDRKKQEEEEKRRQAMLQVNAIQNHMARQNKRRGGRETEREKKKKVLAERRKPLNIDHLNQEKLRNKTTELFNYLSNLETEKYDFEVTLERQKFDINHLRQRINVYMSKSGKNKSSSSRQVKTLANVGAKAAVFK